MGYTTITKEKSVSVDIDVDVEIELEDILEFIKECDDDDDFDEIVKAIKKYQATDINEADPIYEEVLKSDSWESRDKIAFLKTIFEKTSLEEFKNKLL